MARRNHPISDEMAEIEQMVRDLETRIAKLGGAASRTANGLSDTTSAAVEHAGEAVAQALHDMAERVRQGAEVATDRAAKLGNDALKRIGTEVEQRPLLTLAIAAGIGFLAGMAGRRQ